MSEGVKRGKKSNAPLRDVGTTATENEFGNSIYPNGELVNSGIQQISTKKSSEACVNILWLTQIGLVDIFFWRGVEHWPPLHPACASGRIRDPLGCGCIRTGGN